MGGVGDVGCEYALTVGIGLFSDTVYDIYSGSTYLRFRQSTCSLSMSRAVTCRSVGLPSPSIACHLWYLLMALGEQKQYKKGSTRRALVFTSTIDTAPGYKANGEGPVS